MKKAVLLVIALLFAIVAIAAVDKGPASINLKKAWDVDGKQKAVVFDHALHQTNNECIDCHATAEGGKFIPEGEIKGMDLKNPAHNLCWTCHTKKNVSVKKTCIKCHTGEK